MSIYTFPPHSTNTTKAQRHKANQNTHKRSKMRKSVCIMSSSSSSSFLFQLLAVILLLVVAQNLKDVEAQNCQPGTIRGTKPPPGQCNTQNDSECCVEGRVYTTYRCSPPVSGNTRATLTLNSFEENGDGGGPSECDERYHPDNIPVVALSTGWFNRRSRCNKYITIRANGRSVRAMVVDECDSKMGCDAEHDYQPPCSRNIVDANNAVWEALGVPRNNWGQLDVQWSDA